LYRGRFIFLFCMTWAVISLHHGVHADPGMWPFDSIPVERIEKQYGLKLTPEMINQMRGAMVRVNSGGSGAFVSPHGLVATNHHVARAALKQISTKENNYEENGYTAFEPSEEIRIPNYEVNALIGIEDVTERVNSAVKLGMTDHEAAQARARIAAQIEEDFFKETGSKPQVISLYRGAVFHLYKFKRYRDVRLVWAPELQAGFYGGDEESNFHYPRYALDVALFRVYDENGEPAQTPAYLPVSSAGSDVGDLLFIVGNPGSTKRHFSSDELLFERDVYVPLVIQYLEDQEAAMYAFAKTGPEGERLAGSELFGIQNRLKVFRGMMKNFAEGRVVEKKIEWETQKRLQLALGHADEWDKAMEDLRSAQKAYEALFDRLQSAGRGVLSINSLYLLHALDIVAIAAESKKPIEERRARYRPSHRASLEMSLGNTQKIYPELEEIKIKQSLGFLLKRYGSENLNVSVLMDGKSLEQRARELSQSELLADPKKRKEIFEAVEAGSLAVEGISDPWIKLAIKLEWIQKEIDEEINNKVNGPLSRAFAEILRLRRVAGEIVYPDATFSPRLTYGVVKPYVDHGLTLPAYTSMGQAFLQADSRDHDGFWRLPDSWMKAHREGKINLSAPLNFVSTHDTIGGNSGSPVIKIVNGRPEWVGIIFDGNRFASGQVTHSEPNAKVGRSVNVDCRGFLESLGSIYGASYVLEELHSAGRASRP
jgi:hypothetical protein